ncbi:ChrR family anti-sigma-E factor [Tateyamaria sp. SN6-1]|uniref:ChrR family anti-sigma-E factor n=1 Tax=Tateyamaria sp. SN6-1 TaxID=3092148 RepID=UPI0039F5F372
MTKEIKHHLTDAMLMAYAAGNLPEAFNLMVASHISLCDECRARMAGFDAVGGEMLDQQASNAVTMDAGSLAATMSLIAGGSPDAITMPRAKGSILPGPLQDYVGGDVNSIKWRSVGMGVKQAILPTSKDASARLLYIPAGAAMPDHGHHGTEMTMVLQGAFQDEDDYFARGDVEVADSDTHHTPVADIHEDCICLAVTDAPLQFQGILPKIAQRIIRI